MIDLKVQWEPDSATKAQLNRIESALLALTSAFQRQGEIMAGELAALQAEVARNTEVDQSAITLLNGLAAQIEQLKTDPVALQALADNLKGSSDALAAAVLANTPSGEPTP